MSYTTSAMIVATVYAIVFDILAIALLYFSGVTSKLSIAQHTGMGLYFLLLNFLLINLMFYIADRKPKTISNENEN